MAGTAQTSTCGMTRKVEALATAWADSGFLPNLHFRNVHFGNAMQQIRAINWLEIGN